MRPQPRGLELETHEKQQQRDAELGKAAHVFRVGDDAETPRSEQHAGRKVAEDGAELQPLEERHEQDDGQEEDRGEFVEDAWVQ